MFLILQKQLNKAQHVDFAKKIPNGVDLGRRIVIEHEQYKFVLRNIFLFLIYVMFINIFAIWISISTQSVRALGGRTGSSWKFLTLRWPEVGNHWDHLAASWWFGFNLLQKGVDARVSAFEDSSDGSWTVGGWDCRSYSDSKGCRGEFLLDKEHVLLKKIWF